MDLTRTDTQRWTGPTFMEIALAVYGTANMEPEPFLPLLFQRK